MQLYYFETMNPKKVCATAKYLGLALDYVKLDPSKGEQRSPEHLARNPNGKVPVLIDGDTTLWESAAIMAHLALKAESDLFPVREPARLVEVLRWLSWDASHFAPHGGAIYFEKVVKPQVFGQAPDLALVETKLPLYRRALEVLEAHLEGRSYLVGERLSIADFCLGVLFALADKIELPLADAPNVRRWHDGLMRLEAWRNPWPA